MNTKIRKQFVELVKFANLQNLLNTIHWIIFGYICFILKSVVEVANVVCDLLLLLNHIQWI